MERNLSPDLGETFAGKLTSGDDELNESAGTKTRVEK
jgi:hypothetical protein